MPTRVIFALPVVKEPTLKPTRPLICFKQTRVWTDASTNTQQRSPEPLPARRARNLLLDLSTGSGLMPKNENETQSSTCSAEMIHGGGRWMDQREWACEEGAPTLYGSASNGQQVLSHSP